ncbi:MAG TPA: S9 family peptidase [Thermoanaerobaculia bacterium]
MTMRFRNLFLALLAAAPLAAAPSPHPFGLDDVARMKHVSDPEISPDGGWVAYTVRSIDVKEDKGDTDVWMTSWDGKDSVRLTTSKNSENTPRWSPDGRYLAFLSSREDENEVAQVWLLPRGGGEAEKVTEYKGGVEDLDWSPDGKRLVLVVNDESSDEADKPPSGDKGKESGKKKTKKPIVIDRYQFKTDGSGYLGKERTHLALFELATRKSEPLTSGIADEEMPSWSPDGKTIVFVSKRAPDPDRTDVWQIYAIEPRAGAEPRQLTNEGLSANAPDFGSRLEWSPDSKWIAYVQGGPDKLIYYGLHRLALIPAAGGPARVLTPELDRNVQSPRFTDDGKAILFTLEEDQAVFLARIPVAGGKIDRLVGSRGCVSAFSTARGGKIAMLWSASHKPSEVYALSTASGAQAEPRALSHQNDAWLAELRLAPVEETKFKSKDGTPISGFLVKPLDSVPGKAYPTILRIHGGPVGQFECAFEEEWQWFATNGYAVVAANPRGSSGKGEKFQAAIYADWGHVDVEDVVAAVDDAVAKGIADPNRLGIGGWSYGSMLTNYTIASTTRFKAATSGAGSSNALAEYGTDQYIREYEQELGTPWKNLDAYLKVSFPFFHADRITTPTLFLCGDADFNMPLINSEQMYQALRSLGVPTELVIYPGQHHGIRKPSYVRDRLERYVAWYDKYVKNPSAAGGGTKTAGAAR